MENESLKKQVELLKILVEGYWFKHSSDTNIQYLEGYSESTVIKFRLKIVNLLAL